MNVISYLMRRACLVPALVLLVGQAVFVNAQTVLVDFGNDTTYRSLSVLNPDSNGNYWNSLQPGVFIENLVNLQNVATTIDVGWDTPLGFDSYNGPAGEVGLLDDKQALRTNDLPFTDIDAAALGNLGGALEGPFDYITSGGGGDNRVRFQIQGLDPTKKYNLTFFGSHIFSNDTTTVYSVYTDNTYTTSVGTANLNVQDPTNPSLHNRNTVATINNLSPQADNILYVQFVGSNGGFGYLNDMQIETVTPVLTGDYNNNGVVDAADYVMWRENPAAFGNGAGYTAWRANFGIGAAAGSSSVIGAAVPEPASVLLVIVGAIGMLLLHRRP